MSINPRVLATLGLLTKYPLSIGTDGILYRVIIDGVVRYRKRPGPYFYAEINPPLEGAGDVGDSQAAVTISTVNTGVSGPSKINRKSS